MDGEECKVRSIHIALLDGKRRRRKGEVDWTSKAGAALSATAKTCVVWIKSGHEIFQEARSKVMTLLEEVCVLL